MVSFRTVLLQAAAAACVAGADVASDVSSSLTPLESLTMEQVQVLLQQWHLDSAFGAGFQANQYDGLVLHQLADMTPEKVEEVMKPQFPSVVLPQYGKLATLLKRVELAGGVDANTLSGNVGGVAKPSPPARRRQLAGASSGGSGLEIQSDVAYLAFGEEPDVSMSRSGTSELTVDASSVIFSADTVEFSADNGLIANGTDLVKEVQFLLAEASDLRKSVRVLNQEMFYVMTKVNSTCTAVDEAAYSCDNLDFDFTGDCMTDIGSGDYIWNDRTYQFEDSPGDLLDTFHTYVQVELDGSPPCSTEGGFFGTFAEDAQVAICCANHGSYSSAGNKPYVSDGTEGISNAYGLTWTEHTGEFSISNHGGTPCTFFETLVEAGEHLVCCSEGWATGIFVTEPEVTCT